MPWILTNYVNISASQNIRLLLGFYSQIVTHSLSHHDNITNLLDNSMTTLWEIDRWSLLYLRTTIMILKHVYTVIVTLPAWRQRRVKFKGERFRPCLRVRQPVLQSHNAILADGDHVFRHAWMNQWSGVHLGYCSKHQRVCTIGYLPNKQLVDVDDWRIQPRSQGPLKLGSSGLRGPSRRGPWERGWLFSGQQKAGVTLRLRLKRLRYIQFSDERTRSSHTGVIPEIIG